MVEYGYTCVVKKLYVNKYLDLLLDRVLRFFDFSLKTAVMGY